MLEWSGKFLTMAGVIMLALSITPTGDWLDPREAWWRNAVAVETAHAVPRGVCHTRPDHSTLALRRYPRQPGWHWSDRERERVMTIFVGNVPWSITEDELHQLFERYGSVASVRLAIDRERRAVRGVLASSRCPMPMRPRPPS